MSLRRSPAFTIIGALLGGLAPAYGVAAAQDAAHFSPTYAASQGSPYSEIYARTFGTPRKTAAGGAPLETAAGTPAAAAKSAGDPVAAPKVVYIIEGGRLLTYSAADYGRGVGEALAAAELPTGPAGGRLHGAIPPEPAADGQPIPLLPKNGR
jgi:hypothetical protein